MFKNGMIWYRYDIIYLMYNAGRYKFAIVPKLFIYLGDLTCFLQHWSFEALLVIETLTFAT